MLRYTTYHIAIEGIKSYEWFGFVLNCVVTESNAVHKGNGKKRSKKSMHGAETEGLCREEKKAKCLTPRIGKQRKRRRRSSKSNAAPTGFNIYIQKIVSSKFLCQGPQPASGRLKYSFAFPKKYFATSSSAAFRDTRSSLTCCSDFLARR